MTANPLGLILPLIILAVVALGLRGAWQYRSLTVDILRRMFTWRSLMVVPVLVVTIGTFALLYQIPLLQFGWATFLFEEPLNIVFAPVAFAVEHSVGSAAASEGAITMDEWRGGLALQCLFILALAVVMPLWAYREEEVFRAGAASWRQIFPKGLKFGAVHLVMGIPLAAALALALPGWYYGAVYRRAEAVEAHRLAREHFGGDVRTVGKMLLLPRLEPNFIIDVRRQAEETAVRISTARHLAYNYTVLLIVALSFLASAYYS